MNDMYVYHINYYTKQCLISRPNLPEEVNCSMQFTVTKNLIISVYELW